jgi:NAD-dependent deacetylase
MDEQKVAELNRIIRECKHIVFFGGAGVSTESGIPDFRSKDGLYNQHDVKFDRYSPEYLLSIDCLIDHPEVFYEFYRQKLNTAGIEPNRTHYKLAEMEKAGKLDGIITQNIDGLHQKAGSKQVYELHGSIYRNYCTACGKFHTAQFVKEHLGVPRCSCGGIVKPDVVLYDEQLNGRTIENSVHAIEEADLLIVAGTSLRVYPAAGFIRYFRGKHMVLINREETPYDYMADLVLHCALGDVFHNL